MPVLSTLPASVRVSQFPYTIENPERNSAVVEAISIFSVYVRPAYFVLFFQFKVLDDESLV